MYINYLLRLATVPTPAISCCSRWEDRTGCRQTTTWPRLTFRIWARIFFYGFPNIRFWASANIILQIFNAFLCRWPSCNALACSIWSNYIHNLYSFIPISFFVVAKY